MINLGLSRIRALLILRPKWLAIHIAGTNGKGTVAAYIASLLHQQGIKVGRFTSPHLIDRWDCITVSQQTISEKLFKEVEDEVLARDRQLITSGGYETSGLEDGGGSKRGSGATEFEILTATAFEVFNREKVEVGVIEVGLGGRLDATNVLEPNEVGLSIITSIGYDHENILGRTLQEIATQKAGILKEGVSVVVDGLNDEDVVQVVKDTGRSVGAEDVQIVGRTQSEELLAGVKDSQAMMPHQKGNMAVAMKAVGMISRRLGLQYDNVKRSIPQVMADVERNWQGRLQWLSLQPLTTRGELVLLDGAHNQGSARTLGRYVDSRVRKVERPIMWIVAFTKGKDIAGILSNLVQRHDTIVITRFGAVDGMPWIESEAEDVVMENSRQFCDNVFRFQYSWDALRLKDYILDRMAKGRPENRTAMRTLTNGGRDGATEVQEELESVHEPSHIVIAGSLYLVGDVLRMLRDAPENMEEEDVYKAWTQEQKKSIANRETRRQQALSVS